MLRLKAPLRYAARQAPLSLLVFFVHSTLISCARSNAVRTGSNIRFEIHDSSSLLRPQYGRLLHHGFPLSFISPPQAPAPTHSPSSGENGNGPFARRRRRKAKSDLESVGRNQNVKTKRSSKVQPFSPINELAISTATTSSSSSKHFFFDFSVPKGHNGMAFPAHPAKMTEQGPAAPARSPNTLLEPPSSHAKTLAGGWHQIWTSLAGGEMPPPEGGEGGGGTTWSSRCCWRPSPLSMVPILAPSNTWMQLTWTCPSSPPSGLRWLPCRFVLSCTRPLCPWS
ncbi:hypothetical protein Naga_100142g8 [Nannochloropsis gaditana]|uniref:Uncharacterized protein n=1 Tax=Nannochloropsis gaditana TaxID=72520 RepID=W7TPB1_9STRA|nr:hypothetical protein Naga_100142g8 [Nannochloropsis gaditana]